jgi:hypothetical protein
LGHVLFDYVADGIGGKAMTEDEYYTSLGNEKLIQYDKDNIAVGYIWVPKKSSLKRPDLRFERDLDDLDRPRKPIGKIGGLKGDV